MQRVRMLISVSGTFDGRYWPPKGAEVDLPDWLAEDMCAVGYAMTVGKVAEPEPPVETAVVPETDVELRVVDDLDALREQAERLGVRVDRRWGADRLREEIATASKGK